MVHRAAWQHGLRDRGAWLHGSHGLYELLPHALLPHALLPHALLPHTLLPHALLPHALLPITLLPYALLPHALLPHAPLPHALLQFYFLSAGQAGMAEYVKAAGILLGGVGVLLLGYNADAIGEKGLTKIGSGVQGGLEGHTSAEAAGRQFGEEAFRRFEKLQLDHHHHIGDPKRSWWGWARGR